MTVDTPPKGRSGTISKSADGSRKKKRTGLAGAFTGHYRTEAVLAVAIVAVVLMFIAIFPDRFATWTNLENVARHGAILLVIAIGQMFALLVGGFDISVGTTMGLAATIGALVMRDHGVLLGIAAGLGAAVLVGVVNGILIARFRVSPFVATLGMMTFGLGLASHISDGRSVSGLPAFFGWFGRHSWGMIPSTVGIALIIGVITWILLNRSRAGLNLYSIGGSRGTSLLAGIAVRRTEILAYVLCALMAGIGGLMLSSRVAIGQATLGSGYELLSIATAVIGGVAIGGGIGRLSGVLMGVILLSTITTGMNIAGLSEFIQQMLTGAVLIGAVLIDRVRKSADATG